MDFLVTFSKDYLNIVFNIIKKVSNLIKFFVEF